MSQYDPRLAPIANPDGTLDRYTGAFASLDDVPVGYTGVLVVATTGYTSAQRRRRVRTVTAFRALPARAQRRLRALTTHAASRDPLIATTAPRQPRAREHRPGVRRRSSSSSRSSGNDPSDSSDSDLEAEPAGELRPVSDSLAAELARIAERLRARGGVG